VTNIDSSASVAAPNASSAAGPLAGVRVLDFSHFLAGPYATMILADLGADVIKVEDPERPDEAREMGPFFRDDQSLYFAALNWSKRSLAIRISSPEGLRLIHELVNWADVVVDNYRVGVMAKLGLDHHTLNALNPRIISVSITGYGADGPYAQRPGYDYTIQAMAGVMGLTGEPEGVPGKAGISYVDHSGGLAAALAVTSGLVERARTGRGRHVDVALFDVQMSMLTYLASWHLNAGYEPRRMAAAAHPFLVPAQNFETQDGYLSVFVGNDAMWPRFVRAIDDPLLAEPKFLTAGYRDQAREEVLGRIQNILRQHPSEHWVRIFTTHNVPAAPVNSLAAALIDPQVVARDMIIAPDSGRHAIAHLRGPLPRMATTTPATSAPALGEHSVETLSEIGYSANRIAELITSGVVRRA
jgi:crotonobetainyl-CoA:carnitine CoA-transferase CaiB-like acyl-CoA transferase